MGNKSTQANFLVSVGSISEYWETASGGEITVNGEKRFDGGKNTPDIIFGRPEYSDLVVGRSYDAIRDAPVIADAYTRVGQDKPDSITVQPCNNRLEPVGDSSVFSGYLTKVSHPEVDSNSSSPASFQLTFMIVEKV